MSEPPVVSADFEKKENDSPSAPHHSGAAHPTQVTCDCPLSLYGEMLAQGPALSSGRLSSPDPGVGASALGKMSLGLGGSQVDALPVLTGAEIMPRPSLGVREAVTVHAVPTSIPAVAGGKRESEFGRELRPALEPLAFRTVLGSMAVSALWRLAWLLDSGANITVVPPGDPSIVEESPSDQQDLGTSGGVVQAWLGKARSPLGVVGCLVSPGSPRIVPMHDVAKTGSFYWAGSGEPVVELAGKTLRCKVSRKIPYILEYPTPLSVSHASACPLSAQRFVGHVSRADLCKGSPLEPGPSAFVRRRKRRLGEPSSGPTAASFAEPDAELDLASRPAEVELRDVAFPPGGELSLSPAPPSPGDLQCSTELRIPELQDPGIDSDEETDIFGDCEPRALEFAGVGVDLAAAGAGGVPELPAFACVHNDSRVQNFAARVAQLLCTNGMLPQQSLPFSSESAPTGYRAAFALDTRPLHVNAGLTSVNLPCAFPARAAGAPDGDGPEAGPAGDPQDAPARRLVRRVGHPGRLHARVEAEPDSDDDVKLSELTQKAKEKLERNEIIRTGRLIGSKIKDQEHECTHCPSARWCPICQRAKRCRARFMRGAALTIRNLAPMEILIVLDFKVDVPLSIRAPKATYGYSVMMCGLIVNDGIFFCVPMCSRNAPDIVQAIHEVRVENNIEAPVLVVIFCDNERSVVISQEVATYLRANTGRYIATIPGVKSTAGLQERTVRTIAEGTSCLLARAGMPVVFWPYAGPTWCHNHRILDVRHRPRKGHRVTCLPALPFGLLGFAVMSNITPGKNTAGVDPRSTPVCGLGPDFTTRYGWKVAFRNLKGGITITTCRQSDIRWTDRYAWTRTIYNLRYVFRFMDGVGEVNTPAAKTFLGATERPRDDRDVQVVELPPPLDDLALPAYHDFNHPEVRQIAALLNDEVVDALEELIRDERMAFANARPPTERRTLSQLFSPDPEDPRRRYLHLRGYRESVISEVSEPADAYPEQPFGPWGEAHDGVEGPDDLLPPELAAALNPDVREDILEPLGEDDVLSEIGDPMVVAQDLSEPAAAAAARRFPVWPKAMVAGEVPLWSPGIAPTRRVNVLRAARRHNRSEIRRAKFLKAYGRDRLQSVELLRGAVAHPALCKQIRAADKSVTRLRAKTSCSLIEELDGMMLTDDDYFKCLRSVWHPGCGKPSPAPKSGSSARASPAPPSAPEPEPEPASGLMALAQWELKVAYLTRLCTRGQRDTPQAKQARAEEMEKVAATYKCFDKPVEEGPTKKLDPRATVSGVHCLTSIKNYEKRAELHKYKGRLVLLGDQIRRLCDNKQVFPQGSDFGLSGEVATLEGFRCILAHSLLHPDYVCEAADLTSAYLQADWPDTAPPHYLRFSDEMVSTLPKHLQPPGGKAKGWLWPMRKCLYGHPVSGHAWIATCTNFLKEELGWEEVEGCPAIMRKGDSLLCVYVDDICIAGPADVVKKFWAALGKRFPIGAHNSCTEFLGATMRWSSDKEFRRVHICMTDYVDQIVAQFEKDFDGWLARDKKGGKHFVTHDVPMVDSHLGNEPLPKEMKDVWKGPDKAMSKGTGVRVVRGEETYVPMRNMLRDDVLVSTPPDRANQKLIGMILWIARVARPDVSFCVSRLGSRVAAWTPRCTRELARCVGYLKRTRDKVLELKVAKSDAAVGFLSLPEPDSKAMFDRVEASSRPRGLVPLCHADADWAAPKSQSGYYYGIYGSGGTSVPIAWGSKKQSITADSSGMSEFIASHYAIRTVLPLHAGIFGPSGSHGSRSPGQPLNLMADNSTVLRISRTGLSQQLAILAVKPMAVRMGLLKDLRDLGVIRVVHVRTDDNMADALTKALEQVKLEAACDMFGLVSTRTRGKGTEV